MVKKIVLILLMPISVAAIGFVIGIVPGLLLGLPGWHKTAAVVIPIVWAIGYVRQRASFRDDVNWITFCIAIFGGVGAGFSIWLFGDITS